MSPPTTLNVLDRHGGFTAIMDSGDTLWRPGSMIKDPIGTLVSYDEHSFYQINNNVTKAIYKVEGYRYKVAVWFDNNTSERVA